jgi:hypothetical protein
MNKISSITIALLICATFLFVPPSASTNGQLPPIGIIDFYGLRSIPEQQVRQALQIKEGDALPESTKEVQRRLENLTNVEQARLNATCCEAGKSILYVGIRERGSPILRFRAAPKGAIRLPQTIAQVGEEYQEAWKEAVLKGDAGEDDSQGHALFSNPKVRTLQGRYITLAAQDLERLRAVLRESSDAGQRALAAQIIAYHANKRDIVKDLVYGMSDPDEGVRNNSMRALEVLAVFAKNSPKQRIKIPVEPFIDMLNSIEWTDRNKSSLALSLLTEKRDPVILSSLRKHALPSLVEMARWKASGHAMPSFTLLGCIGNLSEEEIQKAWSIANREFLIKMMLERVKSK